MTSKREPLFNAGGYKSISEFTVNLYRYLIDNYFIKKQGEIT